MRPVLCDICGMKEDEFVGSEWTDIALCLQQLGSPNYMNLCGNCTVWMIQTFDLRKKELMENK